MKVTSYNNYCKPPNQKTWWLVHSTRTLCARKILEPLIKTSSKGLENFKPSIHNVIVLWNIAFYMCLSLRVMVKCTGAIFVCRWIESIGWTPGKIVILIQIKWMLSIGMLRFSFILSLILLLLTEAKLIVTNHLFIT